MKTGYSIIHPVEDAEHGAADLPKEPSYEQLSAVIRPLLDGADFERVRVLRGTQYLDMFVDDKGLLKGLSRNDIATAIYRNNWLTRHPKANPETLPYIAGTAILFDRRVWF